MGFNRELKDNPRIHQPSAELFQVFDRLLLMRKGGETVYFGDLGPNATTLLNYFQQNGSRPCGSGENPWVSKLPYRFITSRVDCRDRAEFMLDVIGAGATSAVDWHAVWKRSPQAAATTQEIQRIHRDSRNRPTTETTLHCEYSTSWIYQTTVVTKRGAAAIWRNPTYVAAKLIIYIAGGLFIGFTFWKSPSTLRGVQNRLFSIYMILVLTVPAAQQLQVPFIASRTIYEIRERPSKMYSWSAWVTAQILVELPWNMMSGVLLFLCWYWTVGYLIKRASYTFLQLGVLNPFYYTTIGQAIASMAPTAEVAALLFVSFFGYVLILWVLPSTTTLCFSLTDAVCDSDGVLQPFGELGWWKWMFHLSPHTYLVEALMGDGKLFPPPPPVVSTIICSTRGDTGLGGQEIVCSEVEFSTINPPVGLTCLQYMDPYISRAGGYLTNPDSTTGCRFCSYRTTDQFLDLIFNLKYSHRWRDAGIFAAFTVFNVRD